MAATGYWINHIYPCGGATKWEASRSASTHAPKGVQRETHPAKGDTSGGGVKKRRQNQKSWAHGRRPWTCSVHPKGKTEVNKGERSIRQGGEPTKGSFREGRGKAKIAKWDDRACGNVSNKKKTLRGNKKRFSLCQCC